jgi:hypothetical protein
VQTTRVSAHLLLLLLLLLLMLLLVLGLQRWFCLWL